MDSSYHRPQKPAFNPGPQAASSSSSNVGQGAYGQPPHQQPASAYPVPTQQQQPSRPGSYYPPNAYAQQPPAPGMHPGHQSMHQQQAVPQGPPGGSGDFMQTAAAQVLMNTGTWETIGNQFVGAGQDYMQKNLKGWVDWEPWRYYWNVNNSYVMRKTLLLLFPFRQKQWERAVIRSEMNGQVEGFSPPRQDLNAPDMYIPVMGFVTYILIVATLLGMEDKFTPEVLTMTASTALIFTVLEVMFLRLGIYLLGIQTAAGQIALTDLVCYSGYKFVSVIFIQLMAIMLQNGLAKIVLFAYASLALGWFMLRTLRHVILPVSDVGPQNAIANPTGSLLRKKRVYFLFIFVLVQCASCFFLI